MSKYLDLTGLTTFKSKLDTTYAKKADVYDKTAADGLLSAKANSADVYTKAQVDSAIAGAGGLPTITIALSQVVSQSPLQIQLTNEQYSVLENADEVLIDATALNYGCGAILFFANRTQVGLRFYSYDNTDNGNCYRLLIDTSTKIMSVYSDGISPICIDISGATQGSLLAAGNVSAKWTTNLPIHTTAPSSANTEGGIKIVVLSSEPATRYDGYLYIITESN